MKWAYAAITVVIMLMILSVKWRDYRQSRRREDGTALVLYLLAGILALLLIFFPTLPGPTQLVNFLFGPFGQYLRK